MQDAFGYCAELVRTADRDRYLAALFAPAAHRNALYALYAFNVEVGRVRDVARQPLAGEIRLQWWSEVINSERMDEAHAHPVASALLDVIGARKPTAATLAALIDAHRFDLYDEPMRTLADLENYARKTSSALFALASQFLDGLDHGAIADAAGIASGLVRLLQLFPVHASRRQLYLPLDVIERHHVRLDDIFAGRSSTGLNAALVELRKLARDALAGARTQMATLPRAAVPAFLSVATLRPSLDRLERCDPFSSAELSPWRRQWLIWRAARNPARIA